MMVLDGKQVETAKVKRCVRGFRVCGKGSVEPGFIQSRPFRSSSQHPAALDVGHYVRQMPPSQRALRRLTAPKWALRSVQNPRICGQRRTRLQP
jgi:hypothetical protein